LSNFTTNRELLHGAGFGGEDAAAMALLLENEELLLYKDVEEDDG
jgi:hypothetical protein